MKNRIINHYITTTIGVIILLATLLLVYLNKTTMAEAGILITLASALILSKDPLSSESENNSKNEDNEPK